MYTDNNINISKPLLLIIYHHILLESKVIRWSKYSRNIINIKTIGRYCGIL